MFKYLNFICFFLVVLFPQISLSESICEIEIERKPTISIAVLVARHEQKIIATELGFLDFIVDNGSIVNEADDIFRINVEKENNSLIRLSKQLENNQKSIEMKEIYYRKAHLDYERNELLFKRKSISEIEFGQLKLDLDNARIDLDKEKIALSIIKTEVDEIKRQIRRKTTKAPFLGVVEYPFNKMGSFLEQGSHIANLYSLEKQIRFFIPLDEMQNWQVGKKIWVIQNRQNICLQAQVTFISQNKDELTGDLLVEATPLPEYEIDSYHTVSGLPVEIY